jgi:UDPglucose 6-dehydrogenase/GDP-mannose 6-dehydrogenase
MREVNDMRISIIGTGYVGLVSGICLSFQGHDVICVDKKAEIVNDINNSISPIYEPKLDHMLNQVISEKKLYACTDINWAIENSDVTIVAVGTPFKNNAIDLTYIKECAREIGTALAEKTSYHTVCIKSTVVPGTTDTIVREIIEEASHKQVGSFGLAMNPEFLREGCAVDDFMMPDRIVIGAYDNLSFDSIAAIYKGVFDAPIIKTNLRTAEMIKYTSNSFLANLISFSNDISNICESIGGIDAIDVFDGLIMDKRIVVKNDDKQLYPGLVQYLKPGCGFGGSCFPKDVKALLTHAKANAYDAVSLEAVLAINELQPLKMVEKLESLIGDLLGKKIAVLGIAFKAETDDIRESPAIKIIQILLDKGALVTACDPEALRNAEKELKNDRLSLKENYVETLRDTEGALLVTAWESYKCIQPIEFRNLMKNAVLIDGRRVFDKNAMESAGVKYTGIGLK